MKAIPVAMRERILKLYEQGQSTFEIAATSAIAWPPCGEYGTLQSAWHGGTANPPLRTQVTPDRPASNRPATTAGRQPDATLAELGTRLTVPSELRPWICG